MNRGVVNRQKVAKRVPPWKVVFLGTDDFALPILEALHSNLLGKISGDRSCRVVEKLDVVTKPSKCVVRSYSEKYCDSLKLHTWPDVNIKPGEFDVGVVASFGKLLPQRFISCFPYGILNVHPSLLPKWRGCAPIPYTILSADAVTGVTIQEIQPKRFDIGPIVNRKEIPVPPNCTSRALSQLLSTEGASLMLDTLESLSELEDKEIDQNDHLATYASRILPSDPRLFINWNTESCKTIDRKFRALSDIHDIKSFFGNIRVRLRKPVPPSELWMYTLRDRYMASRPGSAVYIKKKDCLCIQCLDGLVGVREVVMKKPMSAKAFANGYLSSSENKYKRFTHEPLHEIIAYPPKYVSKESILQEQKRWHLQLLRMASSKPD